MGSILMEPIDLISYNTIYNPKGKYNNNSSICISVWKMHSKGIFYNSNPLDYNIPLLSLQLFIASVVILLTSYLLKPLGLPKAIVHILGGLAIGPSFLGSLFGHIETIYPITSLPILDTLGALGFMFYFFLVGVQMDPWILKRIEKKEFFIGFSTLAIALFLSNITSIFHIIGNDYDVKLDLLTSLPVVAIISSFVSFPIVAQYLTELRMLNSELGRTAIMSAMVSNLFSFITIFLLSTLSGQHKNETPLYPFYAALFLTLVIFLAIRPIILYNLKKNPDGEPFKQGFMRMIFIGVIIFGFCSKALRLDPNFGPLMFGIAIPAGPPLGSAIVEKLDYVTSWILMPLYFVKNGIVTNIFQVKLMDFVVVQSVIIMACLGKFFGALFSAKRSGVPLKDAVSLGLVTNFQGILELNTFKMMLQSQAITREVYTILCLSMLLVTGTITPILRHLYDPLRRYAIYKRRTVLDAKPGSQLQLLTCIHNPENVWTTINLLEALYPSNKNPMSITVLHLVELIGYSHPILIHHKQNKNQQNMSYTANSSTNHDSISKNIIKAFRSFEQRYIDEYDKDDGFVTINPYTSISPHEAMHDEVCSMALEMKTSLILIPFHRKYLSGDSFTPFKVGIKIMNKRILEMAPCSVGIHVDRGQIKFSMAALESLKTYRVVVVFLGGPDDREALAIGERMSERPNISLNIIRILEKTSKNILDDGTITCTRAGLDHEVLSEFRLNVAGNCAVSYEEHVVNDATETVTLARSMEDKYDIVIVGRRHDTRSKVIRGLSEWDEASVLGTMGDLFASQDFCTNSTILVVQQHDVSVSDEWDSNSRIFYNHYVSHSDKLSNING